MRALILTLVLACSPPPPPPAPTPSPAPAPAPAPASASEPTPEPAKPEEPTRTAEDFLKALPDLVAKDDTLASARRAAEHATGVGLAKEGPLEFKLASPLDAKELASLLGLKGDLFIVSGDVHQRSWRLEIGGGKVADPHNQRIAVDFPTLGSWQLDITVDGRPPGPLPKLVAGASPAYPVVKGTSRVTSIRFWK